LCARLGHFPAVNEARKAGPRYLCARTAALKFGTSEEAAARLGCEVEYHSPHYWTVDRLIKALLPIIEKIGRFPAYSEMRADEVGKKLTAHVIHYGGTCAVAMKLRERVLSGKLPKKYLYGSRLCFRAFCRLPKYTQDKLLKSDDYYRRLSFD
jgi:hypothetical protein